MNDFPLAPLYNCDGCVGFLAMGRNADGEPEAKGFRRYTHNEASLGALIADNTPAGTKIEPSDWAEGFTVTLPGHQWTTFTVYLAPWGTYSLYDAIPDQARGIDIEDERPLCEKADLGTLLDKLRARVRYIQKGW